MLNAYRLGQNIKYGIDNKYNGDIKRFAEDINYDDDKCKICGERECKERY